MALPFLIPLALALAGLVGAGKAVKAACDTSDANDIASSAQSVVDNAKKYLEQSKKAANSTLAKYGRKKLEALDGPVQSFVTLFKQIKNVEIANSAELENLKIGKFSEVAIAELQDTCDMAHGALQGLGAGAVGGALTAFGAYGGTMLLASAGTGTAISALSGIAATNATLAWLGGGTLAAGGMGVAGGTMALGALVAGPALLIFGGILGAKASKKLSEARENMEKARAFETEVNGVCQKLAMIKSVTNTTSDILSSLCGKLHKTNDFLKKVINENGVNFSQYNNNSKAVVFIGVKYAQLVKALIDTPILNEDGEIVVDSLEKIFEVGVAITK